VRVKKRRGRWIVVVERVKKNDRGRWIVVETVKKDPGPITGVGRHDPEQK